MQNTAEKLNHFNVDTIRADFPILNQEVNGHPLVYLDNAATSQKPQVVIDAVNHYYSHDNSNIHRGVHELAARATEKYEAARDKAQAFLGAAYREEIIFTRGTSEAINLIAQSFVRPKVGAGDEILISEIEHHSNIVPWQMVCEQTGAKLVVAKVNEAAELDIDDFKSKLNQKTKFVAIGHVSNAFGTVHPVAELVELAHQNGTPILLDGAQATPHESVDVQALDCDFYVFSGHKVYAPTGIGAAYGKLEHLEAMPPYQGGGEMIDVVSFDGTTYNRLPHKFEAGTPNISAGIGLGTALDYVEQIGMANIAAWEHELLEYGTEKLSVLANIQMVGTAKHKAAILSFVFSDVHASDLGALLDQQGVAIRVGHHCAMPGMLRFGLNSTARASLAVYNTFDDIDRLHDALLRARTMLV